VLTSLPDEEPDVALVRVVTGPAEPEPLVDPARAALVRVVTGAPPGTPPTEWEPLTRVLTVPGAAGDPEAWERLVLVLGAVLARPAAATPPFDPVATETCSCLTMWTVRRITTVRTSTAGLRAATVAGVFEDGRSASTARAAAASAVVVAAIRLYLLRTVEPPSR
jgi:hypothetical protein